MSKVSQTVGDAALAALAEVSAPLLRLTPGGWCRVAERLAMTDDAASVVPAHLAAVGEGAGEFESAPLPNPVSLKDHLKRQALAGLPRRDYGIAANLIEEIDAETGLFEGDLAELSIALGRPEDDLAEILTAINHLEPRGCGAQSYHQALRCQIPRLPEDHSGEVARLLLTDYWETFSRGGRDILSEISGLGHQAIEDGVEAIRVHLTPYPAERFWGRNGSYLRRGYCHVEDGEGGRVLRLPPPAGYCLAVKTGAGSAASRLALAALKARSAAYRGLADALSGADFDDPEAGVDAESFAESIGLPVWAAWLFADGELIVDAGGGRRYLREMLSFSSRADLRLLASLDGELDGGRAMSDAELAATAGRPREKLEAKDAAALRKRLGVPGRQARANPAVRAMLSYNTDDSAP